jgi:hypothetical protein
VAAAALAVVVVAALVGGGCGKGGAGKPADGGVPDRSVAMDASVDGNLTGDLATRVDVPVFDGGQAPGDGAAPPSDAPADAPAGADADADADGGAAADGARATDVAAPNDGATAGDRPAGEGGTPATDAGTDTNGLTCPAEARRNGWSILANGVRAASSTPGVDRPSLVVTTADRPVLAWSENARIQSMEWVPADCAFELVGVPRLGNDPSLAAAANDRVVMARFTP